VASVVEEHGRTDTLINNARTTRQSTAGQVSRSELDTIFTVNAVGLILLTRRTVEAMKTAGGGNIINIGSI
jgi:short-subunit dehydrogenase